MVRRQPLQFLQGLGHKKAPRILHRCMQKSRREGALTIRILDSNTQLLPAGGLSVYFGHDVL